MGTHARTLNLKVSIENLNHHYPNIKYTASWSVEEAVYLDTRVYLNNGWIEIDLLMKSIDKHQYLCMKSCHPKHCKRAIHYSQMLCLHRISQRKKISLRGL